MALHDRSVRLTYVDYLLFPEDGQRHEILDGEHYVTAAPYLRHQRILLRLALVLGPFIETHGLGQLFLSPVDVLLSRHDIAQPDLAFVSNQRLPILTDRNIQGAPDLVVEILSASTRRADESVKLDIYERFGVEEYWLVDPSRDAVTVYRLDSGHFSKAAELSAKGEDSLTTPLLRGLEISVAHIFA